MKKLSKIFACLALVFMGVFALMGCGESGGPAEPADSTKINLNNQISINVDAGLQSIKTNLYNKLAGSETKAYHTVAELTESNGLAGYYVEVATVSENVTDIASLVLGDFTFAKDQNFELSIGNNHYINDKAFYFEDGKIYVSSVVASVEMYNNTSMKVNYTTANGNKSKNVALSFTPEVNRLNITPVFNIADDTVETLEGENSFKFVIKNDKGMVRFGYEGADTVNDRLVVTKKYTVNAEGTKSNLTYGFTLTDETFDANGNKTLGLYPCYNWGVTAENEAQLEALTFHYDFYILNKGFASLNYVFDFVLGE